MDTIIFYNPKCSKSRQTLELLKDRGIKTKIVEYIKNPPNFNELDRILKMLDLHPKELMRQKEPTYKKLKLGQDVLDRSTLIQIMVENPILIERPIVISSNKAAIGRPPENVLSVL